MKTQYGTIILLLIAIISSSLAQGLSIIAIPWYFTDTLQESSKFSFGYSLITFLGLFWGLYAGFIIDHFNRKKILLYINIINSFLFCLIAIYLKIYHSPNSIIILLGFGVCSLYYIIFFPNFYAIIQELTKKTDYVKINSLIEFFLQFINIIGAATCAFLLADNNDFSNYFNTDIGVFPKWDIENLFLLNSILYLITFIFLSLIEYYPKKKKIQHSISKIFIEIKIAAQFLISKKNIIIYGICSQIVFAFLIVELFSLLPLFVKNCLNESIITFSLADLTYSIGALSAGFLTPIALKKINKIWFTIVLIIITIIGFLLMITFWNLNMFFISSFMIGITNASIRITRMSYFFEKIPNNLMGRVNTIFNSINTIIRGFLILVLSINWFSESTNVIYGYKIGIYVLMIFMIPLIWMNKKELN
tara:strand:+ start:926 stop:2182 length:1257 start_codon:yes stop_codon:yes gene_type:complete